MTDSDGKSPPAYTGDPAEVPAGDVAKPAVVPSAGWRASIRSKPGLGTAYRIAVFVVGLVFIGLGFALAVLPGPLTIPPVLLGLWIWSTEFRFAQKLFESFKQKARETWEHAKRHPLSATAITVGGLVGAGAVIWAVSHYGVVDRARELAGF